MITDLADRTHIYESLNTELRSNKGSVVPRDFVRDFVPEGLQRECLDFLEERHVPMRTFDKDVQDVKSALRRLHSQARLAFVFRYPKGRMNWSPSMKQESS